VRWPAAGRAPMASTIRAPAAKAQIPDSRGILSEGGTAVDERRKPRKRKSDRSKIRSS
jgi:hypothetical protein